MYNFVDPGSQFLTVCVKLVLTLKLAYFRKFAI